MIKKDLETAIAGEAARHGFKARYLIGIAMQESSGRWEATRFEKHYRWLWDVARKQPFKEPAKPTKKELEPAEEPAKAVEPTESKAPKGFSGISGITTPEEEYEGQKTSWGPMQVMGAVARELGFMGKFEELNGIPGVVYGVQHFVNLYRRHFKAKGIGAVISAYNDGNTDTRDNAHYVQKVLGYAKGYEDYSR